MANKKIAGITIEIGADATEFEKTLNSIEKQGKNIKSELREIDKALKFNPGNVELLAQKQKLLADAVNNAKDKLQALKDAESQVEEQFKKGEIGEDQYRAFKREIIETESKLQSLQTAASKAGDEVKKSSADFSKAGENIEKFGNKVTEAGKTMTAVSAGIAVAAKKSYDAWSDTDNAYDTIIKKTGATGETLDKLKDSANAVFTEIPVEIEDVGIAIGEVNTRFGSQGKELEDLTKKFLKFASINDTDVNSSIDNVSAAAKAFGLDASQASGMLDVLTSVGQATGISVNTLESSLTANAATFKEMGLNATEAIQLLGQFEINGIESATALTGLKKAQQAAVKEGKDMEDVLRDNIKAISEAKTETDALQIATDIFGKKGAAEMTQAIREGRFSVDDLSESMRGFLGTTEKTFEATLDEPDRMKVSLNKLKLTMSDLGSTALKALKPAFETVRSTIEKVTSKFKSLTTEQQQNILKIIAIVAAIGPAIIIIGKTIALIGQVVQIINTLKTAITVLNAVMLANPIMIVVAAIAALIAIVVVLYNKCEGFRNFIDSAWAFIKGVFSEAVQNTQNVIEKIVNFFKGLVEAWKIGVAAIKDAFISAWNNVKAVWGTVKEFFSDIWDGIKTTFSVVGAFFEEAFTAALDNIKSVFSDIKEFFSGIWDSIKDVFSSIGTKIGDAFGGTFKSVINSVFEFIESKINGCFDAINSAIKYMNKIPGVDIGKIDHISLPRLAKGGTFSNGSAIVAEAGPELITLMNGRATVTPLTDSARNTALAGAGAETRAANVYQTFNIQASISSDYDVRRLSQQLAALSKKTAYGKGV